MLEIELAEAPAPAPHLHPNMPGFYRRKVADLHRSINDPAIHDEALEVLRGLIEKVSIVPSDNGFDIDLTGEILNMLDLVNKPLFDQRTGSKGPVSLKNFESSVKVVAGARNHRELTLPSVLV